MIQTEAEARSWLQADLNVSRETMERLDAFVSLLRTENQRQNLISKSTLETLWVRHIADSAQLLPHASPASRTWLDLGSGAGFPGLIVAALHSAAVTLVESRKLRVDFLNRAAAVMDVDVRIIGSPLERMESEPFDVISARAFANSLSTFELSHRFSTQKTRWLLPKGASAQSELEAARASWHGAFRLVPSLTDPAAGIIIAEGVSPRRRRDSK